MYLKRLITNIYTSFTLYYTCITKHQREKYNFCFFFVIGCTLKIQIIYHSIRSTRLQLLASYFDYTRSVGAILHTISRCRSIFQGGSGRSSDITMRESGRSGGVMSIGGRCGSAILNSWRLVAVSWSVIARSWCGISDAMR